MDRICAEHKELHSCNVLGLNRSGTLCLIAGRACMGIVNLDRPDKLLHKIPRNVKYELGELQFSLKTETLCAVATGNKVELLDWHPEGGGVTRMATLSKHGNVVTDLSFHEQEVNLLTTCSHDNYVYIWDCRTPRRPAYELRNMTGSIRTCWERIAGKCLATSFDGQIKIWDMRRSNLPLQYISAHPTKIFTLDFSPVKENQLVSSASDNTIKMWDVSSQPTKPLHIFDVQGDSPVWKARYTPFGEGLVTLLGTTAVKREPNNLFLWSASNHRGPVHKFYGQMDALQEFAWRNVDPTSNRNEFQLVGWGRDSVLTMWPIGGHLQVMCGEDKEEEDREGGAAQVAALEPQPPAQQEIVDQIEAGMQNGEPDDKPEDIKPSNYAVLKRELSTVNYGDKIVIQKIDLHKRHCVFQSETHFHIIYMDVRFPPNYPLEPPDFEFQGRTTLSQDRGFAIVKKLKAIAQGLKNQACLEPCLRVYEQEIMAIIAEEKKAAIGAKYSFRDSNVPYPRISGARFCGRGQLVCFGWSFTVHVPNTGEATRAAKKTPRALSAISGNAAAAGTSRLSTTPTLSPMIKVSIPEPPPMPKPPTSSGNGKHKMVRIASVPGGMKPKNGNRRVNSESQELDPELHNGRFVPVTTRPHITIYDATQALNFSVDLAMSYKINGASITQVCLHNAKVAGALNFPDLAKTWTNASKLPSMMSNEDSNVMNQYLSKVARSHECKLKYIPNMCSCPEPGDSVQDAPIDLERPCNSGSLAWCRHPMGRVFLKKTIAHHANLMDFQTAAMLCCVFDQKLPAFKEVDDEDEFDSGPPEMSLLERPTRPIHHRRAASEHGGLFDDEIQTSKGFDEEASEAISASVQPESVIRAFASRGKRSRCNSETPSLQDDLAMRFSNWCFRTASESERNQPQLQLQRPQSLDIVPFSDESLLDPVAEKSKISPVLYLDPEDAELQGALRKAYADMLAKWQLFKTSTEVLKTLEHQDEDLPDLELVFDIGKNCRLCSALLNGGICRECKSNNDHCSVCELKVRGLSSHCIVCGHGGHSKHIRAWFKTEELCPTGCGCKCAKAMSDLKL